MKKLLTGSIDLSKIEKSRIVDGKNGAKYYNVNVWLNEELDQYGNIASIQTGLSKEERDKGEKGGYIGNLKDWSLKTETKPKQAEVIAEIQDDDSLPF
jgi:hypothetical protein